MRRPGSPVEYRRKKKQSGYPKEILDHKRQNLKTIAQLFAFVGTITVGFCVVGLHDIGFLALAALGGAVAICLLWGYVVTALAQPLIALYFENPVRGDWLWSKALARNCVYLDELCEECSTLSSFGFADDLAGETVVWHTPERGIETVEQLLQTLHANPKILNHSAAITKDLKKMRTRLEHACQTETRFCLILHCDSVNAIEIERRIGSF